MEETTTAVKLPLDPDAQAADALARARAALALRPEPAGARTCDGCRRWTPGPASWLGRCELLRSANHRLHRAALLCPECQQNKAED